MSSRHHLARMGGALSVSLLTLLALSVQPVAAAGSVVTFSGRVLTADGVAVPGVRVSVSSPGVSDNKLTDDSGAFSLNALEGDVSLGLGWGFLNGPPVELGLPKAFSMSGTMVLAGDLSVDLLLPPVVAVTAHVHDTHGDPVSGAAVRPVPDNTLGEPVTGGVYPGLSVSQQVANPASGVTDGDGAAVLHTFPGTITRIRASFTPPGSTATISGDATNIDAQDDTTADITVPATATFSGRVLTAEGSPVPGVQVSASSPGVSDGKLTDDSGSFSLNVLEGEVRLGLSWGFLNAPPASLGLPRTFSLSGTTTMTGDRAEDFTLPPVVAVTALVHDTLTNPVGGATVGPPSLGVGDPVTGGTYPGLTIAQQVASPTSSVTDVNGTALLHTFPGTIALLRTSYTPPGATSAIVVDTTDIDAHDDTTTSITVPAPSSPRTLSGRVLTADGVPVPGVNVVAGGGGVSDNELTDDSGAFSLNVLEGDVSVGLGWGFLNAPPAELGLPKAFSMSGTMVLAGDLSVDFSLPPVVAVRAHVRDTHGDPVPGAAVSSQSGSLSGEAVSGGSYPGLTIRQQFANPTAGVTDADGVAVLHTFPGTLSRIRASYTPAGSTATISGEATNIDAHDHTTVDVTVPAPPSAPTTLGAIPGDGAATVEWSPPATDGGSDLTGYTVTATESLPAAAGRESRAPGIDTPGASAPITVVVGPTTTSTTLHGLTNGVSYSVAVRATNQYGSGPAATSLVTPRVPPPDTTDPEVVVTTPADGATYHRGEVVSAAFACTDEPAGSGISSCEGTVGDGSPIPTSTLGEHEFTVTATDLAGNTTVVTTTYTVADPAPDGRIRLGATGNYVGDDVVNVTGIGQTRRGSALRGGTVTYFVSVQNDARFTDAFRLRGTPSTSRFRTTYFARGVDITPAVIRGTYTTPVLEPGAAVVIKVQVKVRTTAPAGSSLNATMTSRSTTDTEYKDTVRFRTSRR